MRRLIKKIGLGNCIEYGVVLLLVAFVVSAFTFVVLKDKESNQSEAVFQDMR